MTSISLIRLVNFFNTESEIVKMAFIFTSPPSPSGSVPVGYSSSFSTVLSGLYYIYNYKMLFFFLLQL